jgi:hypothetical protein
LGISTSLYIHSPKEKQMKKTEFFGTFWMNALLLTFAFVLSGCAASLPIRTSITQPPPLEPSMTRLYITAGTGAGGFKLWGVNQTGPVYLNDKKIATTAKNEHVIVDVNPGVYRLSCASTANDTKVYKQERSYTLVAGETRYLACSMTNRAGMSFGLIGALSSEYLQDMFVEEKPIDTDSRLVAYTKL